jgi:DNA-binding response OmpR family regulator
MASEKTRILIVEDDREICELLLTFLTFNGFQVDIAFTAEEALDRLRSRTAHLDLAVVDVVLPGKLNGFSVGSEALAAGVPTIMVTRGVERDERIDGLPVLMVRKPFRLEELLEIISKVLAPRCGADALAGSPDAINSA